MENLGVPLTFAVIFGFVAFRRWIRHQHRQRRGGTVSLLSGLIWLAIGLGGMIASYVILADPAARVLPSAAPPSTYLVGLVPVLIGIAHLAVWSIARKGEAGDESIARPS